MTTVTEFVAGAGPATGLLTGSPRAADNAAAALAADGYTVRVVRGRAMTTVAGVFDEFAAALQFPYYFGANKDAFDECLRDAADWLGESAGLIVVVRGADDLLVAEPDELRWFAEAVEDRAAAHAAAPFRLILQADADASASLARRWVAAGHRLAALGS
ncbi:barstar family protein [Rhodococcus kronopolitis]|uniref:Barstar family protein n=1 Tax=Rhodococcus kronopolitis TaxID=1460226 RepID=A0ABV9FKN5_9NOCA